MSFQQAEISGRTPSRSRRREGRQMRETSSPAQMVSTRSTIQASSDRGSAPPRGHMWERMMFRSLGERGVRAAAFRAANRGWSKHWLPGWADLSLES